MALTLIDLNVFQSIQRNCKYPHNPVRKAEYFDLLPEQLLSYFGITKHGGERCGLEKAGQVLGIERRIKNHGTKPASQIKKEREQKAKEQKK